ncbi:MAG: hypothetical protein FWB79_01125 [Treponema sp.]|nr:hypothetical protein [Treponema sp.]
MGNGNCPARHDGEYVLTKDGEKDFGEISPEISKVIRRQAGKIRLRIGEQESGGERGYGERHIERPRRMKEIKLVGFDSARDFVAYIAESYDAIYEGKQGALILHKKGHRHASIVSRLEPSECGDFWDVKTAYLTRKDGRKNKKPLWERTQSG